jgi:protein-disulfide isomerase
VNGTPTFFINGLRHDGGYEFDDLVTAIDAALALSGEQRVAHQK